MKSETLLTILLGVLVAISALQAYQLVNLKEQISSGEISISSSLSQTQSSITPSQKTQTSPIASVLDNAPNMVGGC